MPAEGLPSGAAAPWLTPEAIATATDILRSYQQAFGQPLIAAAATLAHPDHADHVPDGCGLAQELFAASVVVLSHDGSPLDQGDGPRLTYANRAALCLWKRRWAQMVGLPSQLTAEPDERASRQDALAAAQHQQAITGYSGIRIDRLGRRFQINRARLWTLWSPSGQPCGQAACFSDWWWLPSVPSPSLS